VEKWKVEVEVEDEEEEQVGSNKSERLDQNRRKVSVDVVIDGERAQ
jgi:hypothetical protein